MGNDGERAAAIDTTAGAGDAAETGRPRGDREFAVAMVGTVVGLLVAAVDLFVWFAPDMTTFLTLLVVAAVGTPVAVIVVAVCGAYAPAFRVLLVVVGIVLVAAPLVGWLVTIGAWARP
ncbi:MULTISPECIES: hypothetical protein [unclassified Curtobacterium]|uniref:hypothetical protein n=1 Tax=unclassified Curtobacterium TaxID=257496 RepID=UPI0008DE2FFA|nr:MULTISPECIES: hypothetical protein [unclassified Curtobacterium]OIH99800.1 hypothetical protein BIU92_02730 [Curtobacterium sp. MCBA15_003]OII30362.1 hypothetical protein BIU94_06160 [Curtobacterium sp. MMLR14_006]